MQIKKAKTQGFCFGVAITLKKAEETVASHERVTTLGHMIWRAAVGEGCELMAFQILFRAAISPKRPPLSSAKGSKKPFRVI